MHTTADFSRLMLDAAIDIHYKTQPGIAGMIHIPTPGKFFTGQDANERSFVNLPIILKDANGKTAHTLVIYQRYRNRDDIFTLSGPAGIASTSLLGPHFNDLSNLEKLLDGRRLWLFAFGDPTKDMIQLWLDLPNVFQMLGTAIKDAFLHR